MKKTSLILATAICLAACTKKDNVTPTTVAKTASTETIFNGSKATVAGKQQKSSATGFDYDYDLVIKQVSTDVYSTTIRPKGFTVNGSKTGLFKDYKISSISIRLSGGKYDGKEPLDVLLETKTEGSGGSDNNVTFPNFTYKGDLEYTLLSASVSLRGVTPVRTEPIALPIVLQDFKTVVVSAPPSMINAAGELELLPGTQVVIEGASTTMNAGLLFYDKFTQMRTSIVDKAFVLPTGHTVSQSPAVSKVEVEQDDAGNYGYVTVTISGDPAQHIDMVQYQPCTKTDGVTKYTSEPSMKFVATHFNQQQGIQRFVSTKKWSDVYGKKAPETGSLNGCMQLWHAGAPLKP